MGSFTKSSKTCSTNSNMNRFLAFTVVLLSFASVALGGHHWGGHHGGKAKTRTTVPSGNIAEVLTAVGATKLVELVTAAGLAGAVTDENSKLTVFAPTNKAFAKLPKSLLDQLASDTELLKKVLLYHVVSGEVKSTDIVNDGTAATLAGDKIRTNIYPGAITVKQVIKPDIMASNGVIHLVSDVINPIPTGNIAEIATGDERFSTLMAAVVAADLAETLSGEGPFTVFAPTNDAFAKIPEETLNGLLADKEALTKVLLRHVVSGTVFAKGVGNGEVPTVGGDKITTKASYKGVKVASKSGQANVVIADVIATDGVIHAIDSVI